MTLMEFNQKIQQKMLENPQWRKGQATFLVAWDHLGEKLNFILGTDKDPFYSDDKIQAFMVYLIDNNFFNEV